MENLDLNGNRICWITLADREIISPLSFHVSIFLIIILSRLSVLTVLNQQYLDQQKDALSWGPERLVPYIGEDGSTDRRPKATFSKIDHDKRLVLQCIRDNSWYVEEKKVRGPLQCITPEVDSIPPAHIVASRCHLQPLSSRGPFSARTGVVRQFEPR